MLMLVQQGALEDAEVKYRVALIAAFASVAVALISATVSVIGLIASRMNQSALQRQQADLNLSNQRELESLKARLTLETQNELEKAKSELTAKNQQDLELLRARLSEGGRERDARRDYEYDAHKRLYTQCEPLIFQLADFAEHAYYRIYSLARSARLGSLPGWLQGDGYYMRSTIYRLISPLVIFRLIQQRLTFVDLTLDAHIASQYRLLKFIYLTFTDAFDLANIDPKIEYRPDVDNWKAKRQVNPQEHWRQGLYLGALDNSIDALLVPGEESRWKTYGEFESEMKDKNSSTYLRFLTFTDILYGFHPKTRPVFWRLLWTQSLIYKRILESQSSSGAASSRVGLAAVSPKLPAGSLDWRRNPNEASDEEVLVIPERVAREYLRTRLPEVFGEPER